MFPDGVPLAISEGVMVVQGPPVADVRVFAVAAVVGVVIGVGLAGLGALLRERWRHRADMLASFRLLGLTVAASSTALGFAVPFLASLQRREQLWTLSVPATLLVSALVVRLFAARWRALRPNTCHRCGHALLATQDCCPECGASSGSEPESILRVRSASTAALAAAAVGAFVGMACLRFAPPPWTADVLGSVAITKVGRFLEMTLETSLERPTNGDRLARIVPRGPVHGSARMLGATNRKLPNIQIEGAPRELRIGTVRGFEAGLEEFRRIGITEADGTVRPEPGTLTTQALRAVLEGLERRQVSGHAERWALPIEQVTWTVKWGDPPPAVYWTEAIGALVGLSIAAFTVRVRFQR
jgi:hypothetical protein